MLITKIDVYGGEGLLVNDSKNRIVIFEKTDTQKRFEIWLSQTGSHQDYPKRSLRPSRTVFNRGLRTKVEKRRLEALHVRVLEKK